MYPGCSAQVLDRDCEVLKDLRDWWVGDKQSRHLSVSKKSPLLTDTTTESNDILANIDVSELSDFSVPCNHSIGVIVLLFATSTKRQMKLERNQDINCKNSILRNSLLTLI